MSKPRNRILLAVASAAIFTLLASAWADTVYKSTDEKGNVTYSDVPNGKKIDPVDLPQINTTPSVQPQPYTPAKAKDLSQAFNINIVSPADGTEILAGQRDLSVVASVSPSLPSGFSAQLLMNDVPYGGAQPTPSFVITEISRGQHQLSVVIYNPSGRIVARSRSVTVYVQRPTILNR
jgi:hypothetical protein